MRPPVSTERANAFLEHPMTVTMHLEHRNDLLAFGGASGLARRIEDYWRKSGHDEVVAWVEKVSPTFDGNEVYAVRSNLMNGLPPREAWRKYRMFTKSQVAADRAG
jgi:hypothetical protein